jgi:hypothetical protein
MLNREGESLEVKVQGQALVWAVVFLGQEGESGFNTKTGESVIGIQL